MTYIIAEAGVDHEGSMERAEQLLKAAVEAGADCFKIQYYSRGFRGTHRELPWLPPEVIRGLISRAKELEIDFLITPHDEWALDWIVSETDIETIKIGSGGWHLLDAAIATHKELIVSCGGKSPERIQCLYNELAKQQDGFNLLHCVSRYPCPLSEANLYKMNYDNTTGYSDHTIGMTACMVAVALGARILEKHMTLEWQVEGRNDTFCSLLPEEWPEFVTRIREVERALSST
jgi:N,N'-diacetyllegionaminate synthase